MSKLWFMVDPLKVEEILERRHQALQQTGSAQVVAPEVSS